MKLFIKSMALLLIALIISNVANAQFAVAEKQQLFVTVEAEQLLRDAHKATCNFDSTEELVAAATQDVTPEWVSHVVISLEGDDVIMYTGVSNQSITPKKWEYNAERCMFVSISTRGDWIPEVLLPAGVTPTDRQNSAMEVLAYHDATQAVTVDSAEIKYYSNTGGTISVGDTPEYTFNFSRGYTIEFIEQKSPRGSRVSEVIHYNSDKSPSILMEETNRQASSVTSVTNGLPDSVFNRIVDSSRFYNFNSKPVKELLLKMNRLQVNIIFRNKQYRDAIIASNNYQISNQARLNLFPGDCESMYDFKPKIAPLLHAISKTYGFVFMYEDAPVLVVDGITPTFYRYDKRLCRFSHTSGINKAFQIPVINISYLIDEFMLSEIQKDWINLLAFAQSRQEVLVGKYMISYDPTSGGKITEFKNDGFSDILATF